MKVVLATFNQEKALVGAFSVIVQLRRLIANSSSCGGGGTRDNGIVIVRVNVTPCLLRPPWGNPPSTARPITTSPTSGSCSSTRMRRRMLPRRRLTPGAATAAPPHRDTAVHLSPAAPPPPTLSMIDNLKSRNKRSKSLPLVTPLHQAHGSHCSHRWGKYKVYRHLYLYTTMTRMWENSEISTEAIYKLTLGCWTRQQLIVYELDPICALCHGVVLF